MEAYLQQYVGEFYSIADTKEIVYIGTDLPDEYTNSNYTHRLKGTSAKAKANAVFALPVYDEYGEIERYNVFHASLIVRHSEDKKLYLYDILDIKKETSNSIEP